MAVGITYKERIVSLLNRDFRGFKRDLMTYSQAYATGSFTDFNESSPGMAFLEFAAYVGDGLSYYIDQALNEMGNSATQLANVVSNAKLRGYRPAGKRPATGDLFWAVVVPASVDANGNVVPNPAYVPTIGKGSQALGSNGSTYETLEDLPLTASVGLQVTGTQFDPTTGVPTYFAVGNTVAATAGMTVTDTFTVGAFQQFLRLDMTQPDVIEVISVVDSLGNEWYEVDYLAQDWVFVAETNTNSDSDVVPYTLALQAAPYRFIVDRDIVTGVSTLVFGSGDGTSFDDELIPNIASYALPLAGRQTYSTFSIDPQNFLQTRSLGLGPHNVTLTVTYRVGGGLSSNSPAMQVRQASNAIVEFSTTSLNATLLGAVEQSVGCVNFGPFTGGGEAETIREIKANSAAYFAAQNRMVTREDIVARCLAIPSNFGVPQKVFAVLSDSSQFSYDVHILSLDVNGNLALATPTLKSNLQTYISKYRMLTDGINILDGDIIDIRVYFGITVTSGKNRSEVLSNCINVLTNYFALPRMQLGQPIVISDVIAVINGVSGVASVYDLTFTNVYGTVDGLCYSDDRLDISSNLQDGMLVCPPEAIFQVKYPNVDIVGASK